MSYMPIYAKCYMCRSMIPHDTPESLELAMATGHYRIIPPNKLICPECYQVLAPIERSHQDACAKEIEAKIESSRGSQFTVVH